MRMMRMRKRKKDRDKREMAVLYYFFTATRGAYSTASPMRIGPTR
jgi:hypothetical protein